MIDYEKFVLETEKRFRKELPGSLIQSKKGLLVIKDKENSEKEYPTVDIKALFSSLKDKNPDDVISELVETYRKKAGIEKNEYEENIIFICENKEKSISESEVFELKDNLKLVYCIEIADNEVEVELLTKQFLIDNDINQDELFKIAVSNMRKKYPCNIITLEEFSKNHDVNISAENVYVLCCEKDDFLFSSAGLYYSADKIKQFSHDKGCDVYIMPVTKTETYLCTADIFSKNDIAEVMGNYSLEDKNFLTNEALVFSEGKLINLNDYKEKNTAAKKNNNKI